MKDRVKELIRVPAKDIFPADFNWRTHPDFQRKAVQASIEELGFFSPLECWHDNGRLILLDGHLRQELIAAGIGPDTEVPVVVLDLSEDEAKKAILIKDPLAGMAGANKERLSQLLSEVEVQNEQLKKTLANIAKQNYVEMPGSELVDPEPQLDRAAELQEKWRTKLGQLWEIPSKAGTHRLLCGDAGNKDDVVRLFDDKRASCIFTDPPYGVGIGSKNRLLQEYQKAGRCITDIENDMLDASHLKAVLLPCFTILRERVMAECCTLFVCAPQGGELGMMMMMLDEAGLKPRHVLIWKKNQPCFSLGRLDYDYQHEPIVLTWQVKHKRPMLGKYRTSVWEIDRVRQCDKHPTMKPVELYINAYQNNSDEGDFVADTFAGSGTAFVAAIQTNRTCYGMEIEPKYVAVALERMSELGCQPKLVM